MWIENIQKWAPTKQNRGSERPLFKERDKNDTFF